MTALKELRRAGQPGRGVLPGRAVGQQDLAALLDATLVDTEDTVEQLQLRFEELLAAHEAVQSLAGSRSATACVSRRALAVVERKLLLLSDLAEHESAFRTAAQCREKLLQAAIHGAEVGDVVIAAAGFGKRIRRSVHSGGALQTANRTSEQLAVSFKLPVQHVAVVRGRQLLQEEGAAWAVAVLERAKVLVAADEAQRYPCSLAWGSLADLASESDPSSAIQRMVELAVDLGVPREAAELVQAWRLALDARARMVERLAAAAWTCAERALSRCDRGEVPTEAAAALEAGIQTAATFGVPKLCLAGPEGQVVELRAEAVWRIVVGQVEYSRGRSMAVCQASAQRISAALAAAVAGGVPESHPRMLAACAEAEKVQAEVQQHQCRVLQERHPCAAAARLAEPASPNITVTCSGL